MSIELKIHTSQELAQAELAEELLNGNKRRMIVARFKNPSRAAFINVPSAAWQRIEEDVTNTNYRQILLAVLDTAAKSIISKQLATYSVWPSSMDAAYFAEAGMIDEATGANSEWLTKEEIEQAWKDSATRKKWVTSPNYTANSAFRKAVAHYESLITKMAGKTSSYTPADLDLILAKMAPEDLPTELGSFITRRIDAIRNRPAKTEEVDVDLL